MEQRKVAATKGKRRVRQQVYARRVAISKRKDEVNDWLADKSDFGVMTTKFVSR